MLHDGGEEVSPHLFDRVHHLLVLKNTALSVCEYDHGKWQLVIWNDQLRISGEKGKGVMGIPFREVRNPGRSRTHALRGAVKVLLQFFRLSRQVMQEWCPAASLNF